MLNRFKRGAMIAPQKERKTIRYMFIVGLFLACCVEAATIPELLLEGADPNDPPAWQSEERFEASRSDDRTITSPRWIQLSQALDRSPLVSDSQIDRGDLDDCEPQMLMSFHHSTETAAGLRSRAHYIASGQIIESMSGLSYGRPGELLRFQVASVLKNDGKVRSTQEFLIFHSYARMVINGRAVCIGKPLPTGEFLLFLADEDAMLALPLYDLESNALVAISSEPSIHGYLFTPRNPNKELPLLLAGLGR